MLLFDKVPIPEYFTNLVKFDNIDFELTNPAFRCLLKKVHVVNAAKVMILIELLLIMPLCLIFIFPWSLLWIGCQLLLMLITIYALKKEKHRFMWPICIVSFVQFIIWAFVTAVKLFIGIFNTDEFLKFYGQSHHEDTLTRIAIVMVIKFVVILIMVIFFWRFVVYHTTRKYFAAKADGTVHDEVGKPAVIQKLLTPI